MRKPWTPERDDKLTLLAGLPLHLLAKELGTTEVAIRHRASILGISLEPGNGPSGGCRERWRLRLPTMKDALRRDIKRLGLDKTPDIAA
jgi:hypothetical protein